MYMYTFYSHLLSLKENLKYTYIFNQLGYSTKLQWELQDEKSRKLLTIKESVKYISFNTITTGVQ